MTPTIDCHVHILGNGSAGSGCKLNLRGFLRKKAFRWQGKKIGLPKKADKKDLDTLYIQQLVKFLETSSLSGAVILANDYPRDDKGEILKKAWSFYVPNDYVIQLSRAYGFFIPGVSIHPSRPDAIDELKRLAKEGAMVLKLLPNYHNVDFRKPEYVPFWRTLADLKIPVLAHTGGETILKNSAPDLRNPEHLIGALEQGVNVIAAHAATKSALIDKSYIEELAGMIDQYPNLYVDNSAFNLPFRSRYYADILAQPFLKRLIHGSDFPVTQSAFWPLAWGYMNWPDFIRAFKTRKNPLQMDLVIKQSIGTPREPFTSLCSLLSKNPSWPERLAKLRNPDWAD